MAEERRSVEELLLEPSSDIDCTGLLPVDLANVPRGIHACCSCFHPEKPLLAMGVASMVGGYDLLTGCRLGRVDVRSPAVAMCFTPDASTLVVATQEWHILAISTNTWRSRVITPRRSGGGGSEVLLAVTGHPRPMVFFAKYGGEMVRYAFITKSVEVDGKGAPKPAKEGSWGVKLKMDVKKPVVGLATHVRDNQLVVLHADGGLRGYAITSAALVPLYSVQVELSLGRSTSAGVLSMVAHPFVPGGVLILQGARGGSFCVLEEVGRSEPRAVVRGRVPEANLLLGMGVYQPARLVLVFSQAAGGSRLQVQAYKIYGNARSKTIGAEPATVADLELPTSSAAARATAQHQPALQPPLQHTAQWPLPSAASWQGLWSPTANWAAALDPALHLQQLLRPTVDQVIVHQSLGIVAVQKSPSAHLRAAPAVMAQSLLMASPTEAGIARATATLPLLRIVSRSQPAAYWPGAIACPVQTPLNFWQGSVGQVGSDAKLHFPCHLYFLGGSKLHKYGLVTKQTGHLALLPDSNKAGQAHVARCVVHSAQQHAWLVFYEVTDPAAASSRGPSFEFALIRDSIADQGQVTFAPGKYGVFLGPEDRNFAVLAMDNSTLQVYLTAGYRAGSHPLFTVSLNKPAQLDAGLFPGPAALNVPRATPPAAKDGSKRDQSKAGSGQQQEEEEKPPPDGCGVVLYQTEDGHLAMAGLPAAQGAVQYAAGDDSDDPDAVHADGSDSGPLSQHLGTAAAQHSLPLLPHEKVLQVSWQALQPELREPRSCAAAVLTTHRLMLVSGDLKLITAAAAGGGALAAVHGITSMCWAGPALLYATVLGKVMMLTWTGAQVQLCSVAAYPTPILAGVLADSLLLLRPAKAAGEYDVATRAVGLLQPLALGWSSLAVSGYLPKGLSTARLALQKVLADFDTSQITDGLLWALINTWCWDMAAELANSSSQVDSSTKIAANAAAGNWQAVATALQSEYESSVYFPGPAPRGTPLHSKFLAAAAGAIMHGQFSKAQECLRSAGEWETSMALAVCQSDFATIRLLQQQGAGPASSLPSLSDSMSQAEVARMAKALALAYEGTGRTFSTAAAQDWHTRLVMSDSSGIVNAAGWQLAGPGKVPAMETEKFNLPQQFITEGELGTIPQADRNHLGSFLGASDALGYASPAVLAAVAAQQAAEERAAAEMMAFQPSALAAAGSAGGGSTRQSEDSDTESTRGGGAPSKDPFADFFGTAQSSFSDSDDESSAAGSVAGGGLRKFKIQIKSKEEAAGLAAVAAGPTGGTLSLKEAAKGLQLGSFRLQPPQPGSARASPQGTSPALTGSAKLKRVNSSQSSLSESSDFDFGDSDPFAALAGPGKGGPMSPAPSPLGMGVQQPKPAAGKSAGALLPPPGAPALPPKSPGMVPMRPPAAAPQPPAGVAAITASDLDDLFAFVNPSAATATATATATSQAAKQASGGSRPAPLAPPAGASSSRAAAAPKAAPPSAPSSGKVSELHKAAVQHMESGRWQQAAEGFAAAMAAAAGNVKQQSAAAQYYAVVLLLQRAAAGAGPREARWYRFAAALELEDAHRMMVVREAVNRNKPLGNYRYCADMLTWQITKSLGSSPMDAMARLQDDIDECDRRGNVNQSIEGDENLQDFVQIVKAAGSAQDVDDVLLPMLAA